MKTSSRSAVLFLLSLAFVLAGCSTGPPPPAPIPGVVSPGTTPHTLSFQVAFNDAAIITPQFVSSASKTYLGFYRIVINTLNTSLIGNQVAVTTSPDTWTDYFQLDSTGWTRNHRIALPNSQQPQQFTGPQAITPGTISGPTFTIALALPDPYLGNGQIFNVSVITYIAPATNPLDLHSIDALGPPLSTNSVIDYMAFNANTSHQNTLTDSGGLGDWLADPIDFPELTSVNYQNYDVKSLTVIYQ